MTCGKGMLFTLEGIDGSGKTTQRARIVGQLRIRFPALEIVETWEPGATEFGQKIRDLVLTPRTYREGDPDPVTLALLILADRSEHLRKIVLPALSRGAVVISDRFADSTYAYQGHGAGIPRYFLKTVMNEISCLNNKTREDALKKYFIHTFFLDLPLETAQKRITKNERWDDATGVFKQRVLDGYGILRGMDPGRFTTIPADGPINAVTGEVLSRMTAMISAHYGIERR